MAQTPLDYTAAGVDYSKIDPLKILAQQAAKATSGNLAGHGVSEILASRGESAYVMEVAGVLIASITECLGTKALVADSVRSITGRTHYDSIAQDTIAMAVNDLITVGATAVVDSCLLVCWWQRMVLPTSSACSISLTAGKRLATSAR